MSRNIVFDSGPLGLYLQRLTYPSAVQMQQWVVARITAGDRLFVPEIVDYEVRRELVRLGKGVALGTLDRFLAAVPGRYMPVTTAAMRQAADLWAAARARGRPTADPKELDGDVILAAQVLTSGLSMADTVVATTNVGHLAQFVPAQDWQTI